MNVRREPLWIALRVKDLPLAALNAASDPGEPPPPLAVLDQRRVIACTPSARELGLTEGMDTATARLLGECQLLARNRELEQRALGQLQERLYAISPHIHIYASDHRPEGGLRLEIASCLRLFDGLDNLCRRAFDIVADAGYQATAGLGHTAAAAWLLSYHPSPPMENPAREAFVASLDELPVQVLGDHPRAVESLEKMGFDNLGDVARQIRASDLSSFSRRLGRDFAATIADLYDIHRNFDQAGLFTQPRPHYVPTEHFREHIQFDYPVTTVAQLTPAFEHLLQALDEFLHRRQLCCQRIQWQMTDSQHRSDTVDIVSDLPQSGWELLFDLTLITFDNREIPFEVDGLALLCRDHRPRRNENHSLNLQGDTQARATPQQQASTLARLKARLGEQAVYKVSYSDSLVPELSHAIIGLAEKAAQQLPDVHSNSLRPSWLFTTPQQVQQRGQRLFWQGYLQLSVGPERLQTLWWQEPVARDYYLARRQDNLSVWVYQDLYSGGWYVHGVFA